MPVGTVRSFVFSKSQPILPGSGKDTVFAGVKAWGQQNQEHG